MLPGELEPSVSFAGKHARNVPYQSREFRHFVVFVAGELFEASNVPGRNNRLMEEPAQLLELFDMIPLFAWHPLTLLADVNAVATPAKLLVRT